MRSSPFALLLAAALLAAAAGAQPRPHTLTSDFKFTLVYQTPTGPKTFTQPARNPDLTLSFPPHVVYVYILALDPPGPKKVWVGLFASAADHDHYMGFYHPGGIPDGWRVDHLEERFRVRIHATPGPIDLTQERVALSRVYGPTFYRLHLAQAKLELYPTFLQTQQVVIEDVANGGGVTMIAEDDDGHRKKLGYASTGKADGIYFVVHYLPDHYDPKAAGKPTFAGPYGLWLAPYHIRFKAVNSHEAAIAWYRQRQLQRPRSFLSRRRRAGLHPRLAACKFAVGLGALTSQSVTNGQYDLSAVYRQAVLDTFTSLHGSGLLYYHLPGWEVETSPTAIKMPDDFERMLPGHKALLDAARQLQAASILYTFPGPLAHHSRHYLKNKDNARVDAAGQVETFTIAEMQKGIFYDEVCWHPTGITDVYRDLLVNHVFSSLRTGAAGAYLDALSPAAFCYGYRRHPGGAHPEGTNEQLEGIRRLLAEVRKPYGPWPPARRPLLLNETPTDCLDTDGSGLDLIPEHPDYWNLFAMTYSGEEWPTFGAVLGWDPIGNKPSGIYFASEFARTIASGARPIILWPEFVDSLGNPIMPRDLPKTNDPKNDFNEFKTLLDGYLRDWDSTWKSIITGRRMRPLDPGDVKTTLIPPLFPGDGDPLPNRRWHIPGYRSKPRSLGSLPSPTVNARVPAVHHGVFAPRNDPASRVVVLVRWTDPAMASRLKNPPPELKKTDVSVDVYLSALNVAGVPGDIIRVIDDPRFPQNARVVGFIGVKRTRVPLTFKAGGSRVKLIKINKQ